MMATSTEFYTTITKRDGSLEPFQTDKITRAITKAGESTGEFSRATAEELVIEVLTLLQTRVGPIPQVEEVQDSVEDVLLSSPYKKTAKAYILYREQHKDLREITAACNIHLIDRYLHKKDWLVKENSNMSFSLQGLNHYIASEMTKTYWLHKIYPPHIAEAHLKGDLHIHDLSLLSVYCVGWDLHHLLMEGFRGVPGKVASKPAKHLRTALGQVINFFYTLQGEASGAQAFSNFDTLLAPFIDYDALSYKEVKQTMQEFLFNVNVPTRVGFQTPFTNITLDLTVPAYLADQPVIIGGEPQKKCYGDFQHAVDLFNKAFLEVMLEGDEKGRVFTFPIPTYNISKDFDWNNPMLDLLWKVTAKYGIPYFANFVNSEMNPEDARSMCCRLRIDNRHLHRRGGGLFGSSPLTGSIGVVTLNMPRLGYLAKDEASFMERLIHMMHIARDSLEIKRKLLEQLTDHELYPYTKYYLRHIKEHFGCYWKNHFSTIGLIGLNEACLNLFHESIGSSQGRAFGIRVLDVMREQLFQFQETSGHLYNLEATPAEGTSYRLAKIDKELYPDILCANQGSYQRGNAPFYTNSSQLPVYYTKDPFELLDLQDELQSKYTGGTVIHLFTGDAIEDTTALRELIKKICLLYRLPYFSITPTFSICPSCGYLPSEVAVCPHCQSPCEIFSRVVGYLRPVQQWNEGKQEEFLLRSSLSL